MRPVEVAKRGHPNLLTALGVPLCAVAYDSYVVVDRCLSQHRLYHRLEKVTNVVTPYVIGGLVVGIRQVSLGRLTDTAGQDRAVHT